MENLLREWNINIRTSMDLSHIDMSTRVHLKNVYASLCISMLSAATGAFLQFHSAFPQIFVHASPFVGLGLCLWLMATRRNGRNDLKRLGILTAFALNIGTFRQGVLERGWGVASQSASSLVWTSSRMSRLLNVQDRRVITGALNK
uniref:bax inhibitor 1-like n=1 Tax=Myxine glutinosa TaxID=7769 RepID=UPI00358F3394